MKRWKVIIELEALRDISEAHSWIAERNPEAADAWFEALYDTIGSLENFPERCPFAPESIFLNAEFREIFHGRRQHKYRILFTVTESEVHVLHVRHGSRRALGEIAPEE